MSLRKERVSRIQDPEDLILFREQQLSASLGKTAELIKNAAENGKSLSDYLFESGGVHKKRYERGPMVFGSFPPYEGQYLGRVGDIVTLEIGGETVRGYLTPDGGVASNYFPED